MIPVWQPVLDGREEIYVLDALRSNWVSSLGPYIVRFEESFAAYCGARHGVACSSGTAALHMALVALGIGPGDEVLIPDFTLIVSANTVILSGAKPVLVDVDPRTWCLDPARLEEKITPRTRAVMPVHMYGHPCDMPAIQEIAKRRNLFVVEDAAEAHGAEIAGRKVGAFGDAGCFSFYGNKILTTGEGGMVVTDDERLTERLRLLRNQAFEERRFVHHVMGFNYRLTNVQAAIGLAQVERLEEKLARKKEIASWYRELLADEDVGLPAQSPGIRNVHWMFGVTLGNSYRQGRDAVMRQMRERGVETRAFFCPMHLQPVFVDGADTRYPDVAGRYPVSEDLWNRGLYLPSGLSLTRAQAEEVVTRLQECRG